MKVQNILVTGAAGFIGFHTTIKLLELGHKVVGVDSLNDYYDVKLKKERLKLLQHKNFTFMKLDFTNFKLLTLKLGKFKFDKIIHLGAQAGVRYSLENPFVYANTNYIGTLNIFEFAKRQKISHVIYALTSSIYGDNKKQPFEESDRTDTPVSLYAATKKGTQLLAYNYYKNFGIKMTGLIFFTVYGPWGRPDMALFKFVKNILLEKPISVYNKGKMKRSFTYVEDIVSGIIGSLSAPKQFATYNLGGSEVVLLTDFVKMIEKNLNRKAIVKYLPMMQSDVVETVASTKLSKKEIGYIPKTDIEKGIKNFVSWFLENKTWLLKLKDGKQ